eukprot:snap_masked-scaffold_20-processed-gene-3.4-mRNA-1 protein AED:0.43 eAED:0.44 QI:0/0/0/1/1/1/2/0/212
MKTLSSNQHLCFSIAKNSWQDELQKNQIKPVDFYESQALKKNYFYHIDLQGRLFLEDILPKNVATSLKAENFLKFFYSNLRPNDIDKFLDYDFISPCGKEMNFIRPADTPIVFTELKGNQLFFTNRLFNSLFDPSKIHICSSTFRVYHPLIEHTDSSLPKKLLKNFDKELCLLSSHLAVEVGKNFIEVDGEFFYRCAEGTFPLINAEGLRHK